MQLAYWPSNGYNDDGFLDSPATIAVEMANSSMGLLRPFPSAFHRKEALNTVIIF